MEKYLNIGGNSNVYCYEIGTDFIEVRFNGGSSIYRYSYLIPGKYDVEEMKRLAKQGFGLNSYINRYVRFRYEYKR